ncbi:hypothetical protein D3C75_715180 [compost metagenome]
MSIGFIVIGSIPVQRHQNGIRLLSVVMQQIDLPLFGQVPDELHSEICIFPCVFPGVILKLIAGAADSLSILKAERAFGSSQPLQIRPDIPGNGPVAFCPRRITEDLLHNTGIMEKGSPGNHIGACMIIPQRIGVRQPH